MLAQGYGSDGGRCTDRFHRWTCDSGRICGRCYRRWHYLCRRPDRLALVSRIGGYNVGNQHPRLDYTYPEVIIMFVICAGVVGLAHVALARLVGQEWMGGLDVGLLMLVSTAGFRILDRRHGRLPGISWSYAVLISVLGALIALLVGPLLQRLARGS